MSKRKVYMVWDGGPAVSIPEPMGEPRDDQMVGSLAAKVAELACRVCYDSLGNKRSRSTADNLQHILDVGHLSVLEHYHATFTLMIANSARGPVAEALAQRPGVYFRFVPGAQQAVRITMNARSMLEWWRFSETAKFEQAGYPDVMAGAIGSLLGSEWRKLAPLIFTEDYLVPGSHVMHELRIGSLIPASPETPREVWITLYMEGSRGFSHELVRHGDFTAISQRSTRYVNEADSEWDLHPLIHAYLSEHPEDDLEGDVIQTRGQAQETYRKIVKTLRPWLIERGVDKFTARKQARGAARGLLGNALRTAVIFSASASQWRHMLRMRAADAADAEIRGIFAEALPLLKAGCYGTMFEDLQLGASSDGLNLSLVGGGAK